jgi:hypothetical protein
MLVNRKRKSFHRVPVLKWRSHLMAPGSACVIYKALYGAEECSTVVKYSSNNQAACSSETSVYSYRNTRSCIRWSLRVRRECVTDDGWKGETLPRYFSCLPQTISWDKTDIWRCTSPHIYIWITRIPNITPRTFTFWAGQIPANRGHACILPLVSRLHLLP